MQCSWGKFQGTKHFVRDSEIFEIGGSRDRESPVYSGKTPEEKERLKILERLLKVGCSLNFKLFKGTLLIPLGYR